MKKLLSILLTLAMLVSLAPAALAAGTEITVSSATAAPGDTVTITVTLSASTEVKSMMITPTYDTAALELVSGEWADAMAGAFLSMGWSAEEPDAVVAFLKNTAVNGSIFEMQFKVRKDAPVGSTTVSVDVAGKTVSGGKETDLSLTVQAGTVTVSCSHAKTETIPAVAATCDKAGSTEGKKCADCGEIITAAKEVPAKGHSFKDGKCSTCGAADPNYVAPCTHTKTETIPAVAATCDKAGSTEGKKCADCGEIITATKEVPAKGHSFKDGKCSTCGAADPNYVAPCTHAKTETIPAVAATCDKAGSTEGKKCADCGEIITATKEVPAKGHSFKDGKCSTCGTADPNYVKPVDPTPGDNSGTCGENATWSYDQSTGTLTVSGSGAIKDHCDSLWKNLTIKKIVINEGITEIGLNAFRKLPVLTEVHLPASLKTINGQGFDHSKAITDVYYGGDVDGWDKLSIQWSNDPLEAATLHFADGTKYSPFSDIKSSHYFYAPVIWAVANNVTGGIGNGQFGPNNTCTRGQVVTFLWAASGRPNPSSYSNPFSDVSPSDYYYKAVLWAVEKGITGGIGNGQFGPNNPCTRAQVVTFLWKHQGAPTTGYAYFSDVANDAYYRDAVRWAVGAKVTGGIGYGLFGSDNPCTRGQIATFLYKALG